MQMLTVGVVGLGVGEQHLASYASIPGCRVKAICDLDEAKLHDVGERYQIKGRHRDYRAVTEDPEIDVVSICTYDDIHAEQTVSAFRHGKHVMVEKPLAVTAEQADEVVRAYVDSGRLVTSNLILRSSPRFAGLKQRIVAGDLGSLTYFEGDYVHHIPHKIVDGWRGQISFYSPIFGGGIHLIDLVRWLADEEVVEVAAMGSQKATASTGYRFDDTNVLLLRFASGALAKVCVTLVPKHPFFHALRVFGSKATFENRLGDAVLYHGEDPAMAEPITEAYPGYRKGDLLPDFIAAIRGNRQPPVSARDVFNVMDICLAAQQSRADGVFVPLRYRLP